jgi:lipopolysaccharide biosynthesis glycosyltransferase
MKKAFTTVLDDRYISGFLITFNSILRSSKNFNYDLVILEWGLLSDRNKNIIKQLYDNVVFKRVDTKIYENHKFDETHRKWTYNCNYRFDAFTLTEYNRVVFFDCDMIFQIDVDEILKYDVDFGASAGGKFYVAQIGDKVGFDGGLMTIGKKYLNYETRDELIKIANSPAPHDENVNSLNWVSDEPILNTYFLDKITFLPDEFNRIVSDVKNHDFNIKNNFQFTGQNKPWNSKEKEKRFSDHAIETIAKNHTSYLYNIVLTKLNSIVNNEINALLEKNIDIYK